MGNSEYQKPITGSITAAGQTIDLTSPNQTIETIQLTGTWVGTLVIEGSNDNIIYQTVSAIENASNLPVADITANGIYVAITNGYQYVRIRSSAWTSGTGVVTVYGSDAATLSRTISLLTDGIDIVKVTANNDLSTSDGLRDGGVVGALVLTTGDTAYEAKVGVSKLTNRKSLTITALDDMYWGYANTVTTSTGSPLYKNQQIVFAIDPDSAFEVWLVASGNNKNARITESP